MNAENGGNKRSPAIYDALQNALLMTGRNNRVYKASNSISDFYPLAGGGIRFLSKDAILFDFISNKGKVNQIEFSKNKIPVERSFFIDEQNIIVSFEDRTTYLLSQKNKNSLKLKDHNSFIRTFDIHPSNKLFAVADRDGNIVIRNIENPTDAQIIIKTGKRITSLAFLADANSIIAGCADGTALRVDTDKNTFEEIDKWNARILSILIVENKEIAVAGFSDGYIRALRTKSGKKNEFIPGRTGVEILCSNSNDKLMAATGADKIVWIYELDDLNRTPLSIGKLPSKVKKMQFVGNNTLYALTENGELMKWECSPENLMRKAENLIHRNFTPKEWNTFIGTNIEYPKKKNKEEKRF